MVNWAFLKSVKFVDPSIFRNERDKVGVASSFYIRLSFTNSLFVLTLNLLTILEDLSSCLTIFSCSFFIEFIKERILYDNIRIFFFSVKDNVEKSD